MSAVKTSPDVVVVKYSVRVAVAGASPRQRKYSQRSFQPNALGLTYEETASGWVLRSVEILGRNVTKSGLGIGCRESIYHSDLPQEEQWVRDAVRDYAPTGSLR